MGINSERPWPVTMAILNQHADHLKMALKSLVTAIAGQRQEIRQALTLFPYFDMWDEEVMSECVQISSIVEFAPEEIILGSGTKNSHMAFFILEGICKIIHHLTAHVKVNRFGRKSYRLYRPVDSGSLNSQSTQPGYASLLMNQRHDFQTRLPLNESEPSAEAAENAQNDGENPLEAAESENADCESDGAIELCLDEEDDGSDCSDNQSVTETGETSEAKQGQVFNEEENPPARGESFPDNGDNEIEIIERNETRERGSVNHRADETGATTDCRPVAEGNPDEIRKERNEASTERETKPGYGDDHHLKILQECQAKLREATRFLGESQVRPPRPTEVKTFFIQVALFYKGSCFGLDENSKDRTLMSVTRVKCLRIPRRFLLQHNPCNIWNRIRLFFSLYLPTEKQILEYFAANRDWNRKKRKQMEELTNLKKIPNHLLCCEIPYSIRLMEPRE